MGSSHKKEGVYFLSISFQQYVILFTTIVWFILGRPLSFSCRIPSGIASPNTLSMYESLWWEKERKTYWKHASKFYRLESYSNLSHMITLHAFFRNELFPSCCCLGLEKKMNQYFSHTCSYKKYSKGIFRPSVVLEILGRRGLSQI